MNKQELYLQKMRTEVTDKKVSYFLSGNDAMISMNNLIGTSFEIEYLNEIRCVKCGRITNKSFSQGYCFPCSKTAPETEACILHPEKCTAHEGYARDIEYATTHCLSSQIVYLANTGGLKVGVTRMAQMPTRWVDQGAEYALPIAVAPNRYIAGLLEVALKKHYADKTNWRKMLTAQSDSSIDLYKERMAVKDFLSNNLKEYFVDSYEITELQFPISEYPEKVVALNFDIQNKISGMLKGIKGQYLFFDNGNVLNVRKFSGYKVRITF